MAKRPNNGLRSEDLHSGAMYVAGCVGAALLLVHVGRAAVVNMLGTWFGCYPVAMVFVDVHSPVQGDVTDCASRSCDCAVDRELCVRVAVSTGYCPYLHLAFLAWYGMLPSMHHSLSWYGMWQ